MSEIEDFFESENRFKGLSNYEQICRVAWFIHRTLKKERFSPRDIADQFRLLHINPPQMNVCLPRLADKKPPLMLWDKRGYYLEGRERKRLDDLCAPSATSAAVSGLLGSLTLSVSDGPERVFLEEAIRCYRVAAFRASIVMVWNLAYDHLRQWVFYDKTRLQEFNEGAAKRFTNSPKAIVVKIEDFDDFKESEFIDACATGKVLAKNLETMLREKLKRRNMAAHPSMIVISQPQADDVISDLVQNIILAL